MLGANAMAQHTVSMTWGCDNYNVSLRLSYRSTALKGAGHHDKRDGGRGGRGEEKREGALSALGQSGSLCGT